MENTINYLLTGDDYRARVRGYHDSPEPRELHKGAKGGDIKGLKSRQTRNLIEFEGDYSSKFTIGYEIEKNRLHRTCVKEYNLFKGFERDSSCGVSGNSGFEAVTNILPLLPPSQWRNKVFNMFHEAKKVINDEYSPSNKRCGGHISIAVEGMSGAELIKRVRRFSGVIMAMYERRLKNGYCNHNMRMLETAPTNNPWRPSMEIEQINYENNFHPKYQMCLDKGKVIEFRVPSRFTSVKQCMRRYEFFYLLIDTAVNHPKLSYKAFLKKVRPTLMSMYDYDETKVDYIFSQSVHYRDFIMRGRIHESIAEFTRIYQERARRI